MNEKSSSFPVAPLLRPLEAPRPPAAINGLLAGSEAAPGCLVHLNSGGEEPHSAALLERIVYLQESIASANAS